MLHIGKRGAQEKGFCAMVDRRPENCCFTLRVALCSVKLGVSWAQRGVMKLSLKLTFIIQTAR